MFLQRDSMANRERIAEVLEESRICGSERDRRISSLLVSLAIGSINDVKDLRLDPGSNLLQKVRQKIVLNPPLQNVGSASAAARVAL